MTESETENVVCFRRKQSFYVFNPQTMGVVVLNEREANQFLPEFDSNDSNQDRFFFKMRDIQNPKIGWGETLKRKLKLADFFVNKIGESISSGAKARKRELVLNVAQACNLSCSYCFSDNTPNLSMTFETAKKAIDQSLQRSGSLHCHRLSFFGGEPLLNFGLIKSVAEYHRQMCQKLAINDEYFMITNGTLITKESAQLFDEYMFEIQISIDGSKLSHDKYRKTKKGEGTFDTVFQNLQKLSKYPNIKISTSSVITKEIAVKDIFEVLKDFSLENMKLDMVYDFHDAGDESFLSESDAFADGYGNQIDYMAENFVDEMISMKRPAEYNLRQGILLLWRKKRKSRYCPAAENRVGVGAEGKYYPCGASASLFENEIGNVDGGIDQNQAAQFNKKLDFESKEPCASCWAKSLCMGGCPLTLRDGPSPKHCRSRKRMAEATIFAFAEIRRRNPMSLLLLVDEAKAKDLVRQVEAAIQ